MLYTFSMSSPIKQKRILISWVGQTDLSASRGLEKAGVGPVAQAVSQRSFDLVLLLSNYPKRETADFIKWLQSRCNCAMESHLVDLSSPTNFGEIYEAVTSQVGALLRTYGSDAKLTYHLSPGTPAMAAVWIIVAKTRFAAELIESSREQGVRTATVPFDIAAEFIPDLFKRPDADLTRLSGGASEEAPEFAEIMHRSALMKRVIEKARQVAPRSIPVLIEGESGTGKELLARAIHFSSPRSDKPFIAVNCGAIAAELAESEFFGHKKGAFTGAVADRAGHFESAQGGTLFLDEIGELPYGIQVKLLRVLQESQVVRLGTSTAVPVNVRIIAATNRTLSEEVGFGRFREDLFFRIAVAVIKLPPLRDRSGDVGLLVDHILERINKESAAEPSWEHKKLSAGARNIMLQHPWPGNVRELMNTLTRATVWSRGVTITEPDIRDALLDVPTKGNDNDQIINRDVSQGVDLQSLLAKVARHYIARAITEAGGNKSKAAELLGLSNYQTFNNWVKKYGLER